MLAHAISSFQAVVFGRLQRPRPNVSDDQSRWVTHDDLPCRGNSWLPCVRLCVGLAILWSLGPQSVWGQRRLGEGVPAAWQLDAELTAVKFLSPEVGWVVGEHGTLLRTEDGGRTWLTSGTSLALSPHQGVLPGNMQQLVDNLRTNTGGETTTPRQTLRQSVDVRLESVDFIDRWHGVAVGGYNEPGTPISRGVSYYTSDGGTTWEQTSGTIFPKLNRLHMADRRTGWAAGFHSHLLGSGICSTFDGGRTWHNEMLSLPGNWQDAWRFDDGWVLLSAEGVLFRYADGRLEQAVLSGVEPAPIQTIAMQDGQRGWAVGHCGAVWETTNGGLSWQAALSPEAAARVRDFDFDSAAWTGQQLWLAGSPGTQLVAWNPHEQSLQIRATHQNARLRALSFCDERHGWAVGVHGTILKTSDGGATWERQRGEPGGLTLLTIAWNSTDPLCEILAKTTLGDGFTSAALRLNWQSQSDNRGSAVEQAVARLGGSETRHWYWAPQQPWNSEVQQRLVRRLVRVIRELQPRVIAVDRPHTTLARGENLDAFLILDEAIRGAADPNFAPEHREILGLNAWRVERLAVPTWVDRGDCQIERRGVLGASGLLLEDETAIPALLAGVPRTAEPLPLRLINYHSAKTGRAHQLLGDLLSAGGLPQRPAQTLRRGNLSHMQRTMQKNQIMQQLWGLPVNNLADQIRWEQSVGGWLSFADREAAGIWLLQLAEGYFQRGELNSAALALNFLIDNYPEHPLNSLAWGTLAHYFASREAQVAANLRRPPMSPATTLAPTPPALTATAPTTNSGNDSITFQPLVAESPESSAEPQWKPTRPDERHWLRRDEAVAPASFQQSPEQPATGAGSLPASAITPPESDSATATPASATVAESAPWGSAITFLNRLRQRDPELAQQPTVKALEAHVLQNSDSWTRVANHFRVLVNHERQPPDVRRWALEEMQWQQQQTVTMRDAHKSPAPQGGPGATATQSPRGSLCSWASTRPRLDGKLDDPLWRDLRTQNAGWLWTTGVTTGDWLVLAHDEEFLYLGIECEKLPGVLYPALLSTRERNEDLRSYDRVELEWDLDRDGSWPLQINVDCRGGVYDGCGGSPGWDPEWYVAARQTDAHWTIEAAVPWTALGGAPASLPQAWRIRMARKPPRKDYSLWTAAPPPAPRSDFLRFPNVGFGTSEFLVFPDR